MITGKRAFDILIAGLGIILLLPIIVFISFLIVILDGRPIFFRQERVGYKGKTFKIYKFRTMVVNAEAAGCKITIDGDDRITRLGEWLRHYKLDELPQLFNVITGEMSLVGPRPEVSEYVERYSDNQRAVLELIPGITDPASIEFRSEAAQLGCVEDPEREYLERIVPEKIRLNLEYAEQSSRGTDFIVLVRTIWSLLR